MNELCSSAHGRVNLIGDHTDYNDGFVLPMPIGARTRVCLRAREDDRVRAWSSEYEEWQEYRLGAEQRTGGWIDYVMGCTHALRSAGHELGGVELRIESDVPLGSGLSSSAALEVALLRALRDAFGLVLDDVTLALLGQRAENELVGAPVGAMDQLCASLGQLGSAMLIDMRSLDIRRVALPDDIEVLVIASGIRHDHASGDYRVRRAECEQAAALLGVASLRDLGPADRPRMAGLPAPLDRRVAHVVSENQRVLASVAALESGDHAALGRLFAESHASLRDDFEVSLPVIDALVDIAVATPQVFAARLTGGGFGGSIVALAEAGSGQASADMVAARYAAQTGHHAQVLLAAHA